MAFDNALRSSKSARVSAVFIVGRAADRARATAARMMVGGSHAGVAATAARVVHEASAMFDFRLCEGAQEHRRFVCRLHDARLFS